MNLRYVVSALIMGASFQAFAQNPPSPTRADISKFGPPPAHTTSTLSGQKTLRVKQIDDTDPQTVLELVRTYSLCAKKVSDVATSEKRKSSRGDVEFTCHEERKALTKVVSQKTVKEIDQHLLSLAPSSPQFAKGGQN